jgi:hypothetical protein
MRLVYAGILILVGLLAMMVFVNRFYPDIDSSLMGKLLLATIVILIVAAYFLFNKRGAWKVKNIEIARMFQSQGELTQDNYRVRRAFELADAENKVTWYVLELENGNAICLWDKLPAGPPGFDPEKPEVRRFPCTEFTILRHKTGFIVDITCGGEAIKPEVITLPAKYDSRSFDFLSEDGEVIPGETFDTVKAKVLKATRPF